MDSQARGTDWRSTLLLIFSLSGMALTFIAAIGTFVLGTINEGVVPEMNSDASPLVVTLTASAIIAMGFLLLPTAWLSLQRLRGKEIEGVNIPPLRPWAWIAIFSVWFLAMLLATLFYAAPGASWYLPLLHFFSVGLPIYIVTRLGVAYISLGSGQRVWGVFGCGMILSPMLAAIAEIFIVILGIIIVAIFLGVNPEMVSEVQNLVTQIEKAPDLESMAYLLEPLLRNPLMLLTALMFLSVFVPFIEETVKSLGIWLVADRISSAAQGFGMGILSGAGFAFAESLFASIAPDDTWALTLSMRAISGSMHMLASGLVGWGIAYARLEKRYFRMIGMAILAMLLHGLWNAGAVLGMTGGLHVMLALPGVDALGTLLMLGGFGLLFILIPGMFVALFLINRKLRISTQLPALPVG